MQNLTTMNLVDVILHTRVPAGRLVDWIDQAFLLSGSLPERVFVPPPQDQPLPLPESQLRLLVTVLGAKPGLVPIWNWQRNGVPVCRNDTRSEPAPAPRSG